MNLLLAEIDVLETSGVPDVVEVRGVEHDSRRVTPGDLFCCLPGERTDGRLHAPEAVARGAVGIVSEGPIFARLPDDIVQVRIAPGTTRPVMARHAASYWGHPARALLTAGVTGTNGKTSVTHFLGAVLEHAGHPTTVIGTLSGSRTTPEATELHRTFAAVRDSRPPSPKPAVAMEVSSHALVQSRVDSICFDVAVFTNLSHDHLDFHGSIEAYFEAKAILFEPGHASRAVVNGDDPRGRQLADRGGLPTDVVRSSDLRDVGLGPRESRFIWRDHEVRVPMTGMINVVNAHLAVESAVALGVPTDVAAAGLSMAAPVPGRLQPVSGTGPDLTGFEVLVDYAHTPAALEAVLEEARRLVSSRSGHLIVVFGCGGDRDTAKRPVMGAVAARLADSVVVTSDNPRHEDPLAIIDDIVRGLPPDARLHVEPDRRTAIEAALRSARPGDVVVIAGKGHETSQVVGDESLPFDDREVAAELVSALHTRSLPPVKER